MRILNLTFLFILISWVSHAEEISEKMRSAPTPKSVWNNREGIQAFKGNSPTVAQEKFVQGLSATPFEAKLHLNLGLSFETLGQNEKAQAAYETALKFAQDDETKFVANFNLGQMQQKAKNKDEALKYYQEALKYQPNSVETKTNIELLTQDGQGGGGQGDQQKKDQQDKDGKGDSQQQQADGDKEKEQKDKDGQGQQDKPKQYGKNKPQPQKFKSEELTQGDVNKILGEIKQQEQKIRADFNKREVKEQPNAQDW